MTVLINNFAYTTLAGSINASQTTLSVASGDGALFPSPTGADWFPLILIKTVLGSPVREIVHCTSRTGDVLTISRGEEGSSAAVFTAGDIVQLAITQEAMAEFLQNDDNLASVSDAATARSNLGLGSMAVVNSPVPIANGGTGATDAATARTNLGLGPLATASSINDSNWSGTDLSVANGGTGASDAATARTNLGLGTLAVANSINNTNWSGADLDVANGGTGASTASAARTNLGLGTLAVANSINNDNWSGTDLAVANGGTGASDAATARTNLGLGPLATASSINDSNWSGTDLSVANGGTGASTEAAARTNLGVYSTSEVDSGFQASPTSVTGFTAISAYYIDDDGDSQAGNSYDLSGETQTTWFSVGPTGSGADIIWTALDALPADTKFVTVYAKLMSSSTTSFDVNWLRLSARRNGSSADEANCRVLESEADGFDTAATSELKDSVIFDVPVTSRVFQLQYTVFSATLEFDVFLKGFGV